MGKIFKAIEAFWETLGRPQRKAAEERSTSALDLLTAQPSGEMLVVGTLSRAGDKYLFSYSDAFRHQAQVPPIPEFPDKHREYVSLALWPFFDVRLPPTDRPDVSELMRERKLDQGDTFRLLAELGRKSVTTPYEFRLHDPSPAT